MPEATVDSIAGGPFEAYLGACRVENDCACPDAHASTVKADLAAAHMYLACKVACPGTADTGSPPVEPEPEPRKRCGCAAAPGPTGGLPFALSLIAVACRRSARR